MSSTTCPDCGSPASGAAGAIVDCESCGASFYPAATPELLPAAAPDPPPSSVGEGAGPTDVGAWTSGGIALVATGAFYTAVIPWVLDTYLGELFAGRGWVPYGITWLSAWAAVMLLRKAWLIAGQHRALHSDWLPRSLADRITPDTARAFESYLARLEDAHPGSFGVRRVRGALSRFRVRPDVREVVDQLGQQAQADAQAVDASYTLVRVFVWAIPILGFIGTVLGIGTAVAAFSDSVAAAIDLEVMKQSIGSVTTGLGVAFDTTLLALVMSLVIMFPASALQKSEEDLLAEVDAYCQQQLVRRLEDGGSAAHLAPVLRGLTETLERLEAALELRRGAG
ncbi:MAG: MotA/TolQ/ExbB proton channel family protein [Proteobacteria bacterium]|nr:MotA/TolQ/ExbB proton channel family protein [Pseudomonadota bacterium]